MDSAALLALFFEAQDLCEAGDAQADAKLQDLVRTIGDKQPSCAWPQDSLHELPPASILLSAALNGRAEIRLDRAAAMGFPLLAQGSPSIIEAEAYLCASLEAWPQNVTALMSLALLSRDTGDADRALALWTRVSELPQSPEDEPGSRDPESDSEVESDDGDTYDWADAFVYEPRRRCLALATMHRALLASQLGKHAEAIHPIRSFGFRWRLSPAVWNAARVAPRRLPLPARSNCPVRFFPDAVPREAFEQLRRAFAPGAAYWRETKYHSASVEKRYFTWYVDLRALPTPHDNVVERLIRQLAPLTGDSGLQCAEWWVHSRGAGRGVGHELHYDLEEAIMEAGGAVVHPAVSSVVYLSDAGDPTLVIDETMDGPPGTEAYLVHPSSRAFLTFRGDLLHGVLPGAFNAKAGDGVGADAVRAPAAGVGDRSVRNRRTADMDQRLVLLIAWYGEQTVGAAHRSRLSAQSSVPRVTRSQTWPAELQLRPADRSGAAETGHAPKPLTVEPASPVWEELPPSGSCELKPPGALRQHFFLHTPDDVRIRLTEEHGVGGSWAAASKKRRRNK